jgi:hypothetical protein
MANHLRKNRTSPTAGETIKDAERFSSVRALALMKLWEQERILKYLGERVVTCSEVFDKWADDLTLAIDIGAKDIIQYKKIPDEV